MQLSQRADRSGGLTLFNVVVTRADSGEDLLHEYCAYYIGVRPDRVTDLRLEGSTVKWEWSENAFDLASPGACFERALALESGRLVWAGDVVRTPKPKRQAEPPAAPVEQRLLQSDISVKHEWVRDWGQERVRIIVTHPRSGTELVWKSQEHSSRPTTSRCARWGAGRWLRPRGFCDNGSESGDKHACNMPLR